MDSHTLEQALRREAIRRRLQGERPCEICRDLQRSDTWLTKWWNVYQRHPQTDFAARSRAPQTSPHQLPPAVEWAVLTVRRTLAAGQTAATRYGLIGHRAIRSELERLGIQPLPSLATIQRMLARQGLTQPCGAAADHAYYPEPCAERPNALHATDLITRHLQGGQVVQNVHPFDHYSHAVHLSQYPDKSCTAILAHLLGTWRRLGIPQVQQFDNEATFRGGHSHPRVLGQVVRLCLFVGVEVVFIPLAEAKRNHWVEGFHALWVHAFWSRYRFRDLAEVHREVPLFLRWYHHRYRPPSLDSRTPTQMRHGWPLVRLTAPLVHLIPDPLPITAGRINFLRKVDARGIIPVLNEPWMVGPKWRGQYVWVQVHTAHQTLTIWHQPEAHAPWQHLKTYPYRFSEPVHPVLPEFRRNRQRCREHWPG